MSDIERLIKSQIEAISIIKATQELLPSLDFTELLEDMELIIGVLETCE